MNFLGFTKGADHGVKRATYLFPLVKNLNEVINKEEKPIWYNYSIKELTKHWKERWAIKRENNEKAYFSKEEYISELKQDLENCKKLVQNHG